MTVFIRALVATLATIYVGWCCLRAQDSDSRPATPLFSPTATLEAARKAALVAYDDALLLLHLHTHEGNMPQDILFIHDQLISESDSLIDKLETPQYVATVPERDVLSSAERSLWGKGVGVTYSFSDQGVLIESASAETNATVGLASIVPTSRTPWHDLVIDIEFTIVKGEFTMHLRYDDRNHSYWIRFGRKDGYELRTRYHMTIRLQGSHVRLKAVDQPESWDRLPATTSPNGGIAFAVEPGSQVLISSLKLKVLR